MALISCPNCGNEVSDKAEACPHCGFVLKEKEKVTCPECGKEVDADALVCPFCGNPLKEAPKEEVQKVELSKVAIPKAKINKKVLIGLAAALLVVLGIFMAVSSNREKEYVKNYKAAVSSMLSGGARSETVCNEIVAVWSNSINHKFDPKTNMYTLTSAYRNDSYYSSKSGSATSSQRKYFNDDFNTSLSLYFLDSGYTTATSSIKTNQESVSNLMQKLSKPPKGYENAYSALDSLYDSYLTMTQLALDPQGSLNSYSQQFHNADNDLLSCYKKAQSFCDGFTK